METEPYLEDAARQAATDRLRQLAASMRGTNMPSILSLSGLEARTYDEVMGTIQADHPDLMGAHARRALTVLFGLLQTGRAEAESPSTTNAAQITPMALRFLGLVASAPSRTKDPVKYALGQAAEPTPAGTEPTHRAPHRRSDEPNHAPTTPVSEVTALMDGPPQLLLQRVRTALLSGQFTLMGDCFTEFRHIVGDIAEHCRQNTKHPSWMAKQIATHYMVATTRLLYPLCRSRFHPDMVTPKFLPHFDYYLDQALALQQSNVARPYRRALSYSVEDIDGLYDYWVGGKRLPGWAFDSVLESTSSDIDRTLQLYFDRYGSDLPLNLRWLQAEPHLEASFVRSKNSGSDFSLGHTVADPNAREPLGMHIRHEDSAEWYDAVSQVLRTLPHDEALAFVVVHGLNLKGSEQIDTPALLARLGLSSTATLAVFVAKHVMPKVRSELIEVMLG